MLMHKPHITAFAWVGKDCQLCPGAVTHTDCKAAIVEPWLLPDFSAQHSL